MLRRLFLLFVLVALIAGSLYYWTGRRGLSAEGIGLALRDTATTGSVKAALGLNRHLEPYSLAVSTEDGVVTLRGDLPRDDLRDLAVRVTQAVPDVRQVVTHIQVSSDLVPPAPDRSLGESVDDHALELKLRLAFSLHRGLSGAELATRSFRRNVTVSGEVDTPEQRRLALEVARNTHGVGEVADEIRVTGTAESGGGRPAALRALAANPHLARYGLDVGERHGRLVLSGRVRTGAEKALAGHVVREASGRPVDNTLVVRP